MQTEELNLSVARGAAQKEAHPTLSLELTRPADWVRGVESQVLFQIVRAAWLGEGLFGRVFSAQGFIWREGRVKPVVLALKIFLRQFQEDPLYQEVDVRKYLTDHEELKHRGLPVFSTLRVIRVGQKTIGFAMTNLSSTGDTIFSINEAVYTARDVREQDFDRWQKLGELILDDDRCEQLAAMLMACAAQATACRVKLDKDDCFFVAICPSGEMRVLIGDLDNVEIRSLDGPVDQHVEQVNNSSARSFIERLKRSRRHFHI